MYTLQNNLQIIIINLIELIIFEKCWPFGIWSHMLFVYIGYIDNDSDNMIVNWPHMLNFNISMQHM